MSVPHVSLTLFIHIALVTGGCATRSRQDPTTQTSLVKDQRPAEELLTRGQDAAFRGDAARAEQYLALAIERGAERRTVIPALLRACLASSHLRAALNHAEPYLRDHPEQDPLRYLVATIRLGLGQVAAARHDLQLLLARDPSNPDAHYLLGVIDSPVNAEAARGHFLEAIANSRDADQRVEIHGRLAELRLLAGRSGERDAEPFAASGGAP
jgi:Flp pilus assembly protein TadD